MVDLQIQHLTVSRNIALTFKGYFEADEEIKKYKHKKYSVPIIVETPISQNNELGEIDIMKNTICCPLAQLGFENDYIITEQG